ncbi:MAG: DUF547 domain-containing protein [Planctomycetota bacterium]
MPPAWLMALGLAGVLVGAGLAVGALPVADLADRVSRRTGSAVLVVAGLIAAVLAAIVLVGLLWKGIGMRRTAWLMALTGAAAVLLGGVAQANRDAIRLAVFSLATGPQGVAAEKYADQVGGETFDHAAWDAMLKQHVAPGGWVNYAGFAADEASLDIYLAALGSADYDALSRDAKLAYLINAYNAFTIKLILDHWDDGRLESIMDIAGGEAWDLKRWNMAGQTVSLNELEHEIIRKDFLEPRIHFVVVCAAFSCPPLRSEAYTAEKLEAQLQEQTVYSFNHPRWLIFDGGSGTPTLRLTKLLDWYAGDFTQVAPSVEAYAGEFNQRLGAHLAEDRPVSIQWIDYSWLLNDQRNKP